MGSILALGAIGLTLIFGVSDIPNFAHGELLLIGAYVALLVNRPEIVPGFNDVFVTGAGTLTLGGFLFVLIVAAGSLLSVLYWIGGRSLLRGESWPIDVPGWLGLLGTLLVVGLFGVVVASGVPSIWLAIPLAALFVAAIAPLQEKYVYTAFRAREAAFATLAIAALGVDYVLRFGVQSIFGAGIRRYDVDATLQLFGESVSIADARYIDIYLSTRGLIVEVIQSGLPSNPRVMLVGYSPAVLAVVVLGTALVGGVTARQWSRRFGDRHIGQLFGPATVGVVSGVVALFALTVALPTGVEPGSAFASTRLSVSPMRASVLFIAFAMMVFLHFLLQETRLGKAMRATSDNRALAQVAGIHTENVMIVSWVIAGAFGAIAGVTLGILFYQLSIGMGFFLLLPMFAGVILGGIGSVYGAMVGSFVMGLSMDVGIYLIPGAGSTYRIPIAFAVLVVILLVKPEGIYGGS